MGAIPQVPDRNEIPPIEKLHTCDHCSFNGFRDEGDFIDIRNLVLCVKCYKIYNFTCSSCKICNTAQLN